MSSVSSNEEWKNCLCCKAEYQGAVCGYCGSKPKKENVPKIYSTEQKVPRIPTEVTDEEFDEMEPENG